MEAFIILTFDGVWTVDWHLNFYGHFSDDLVRTGYFYGNFHVLLGVDWNLICNRNHTKVHYAVRGRILNLISPHKLLFYEIRETKKLTCLMTS
jgi:hypothetical protein